MVTLSTYFLDVSMILTFIDICLDAEKAHVKGKSRLVSALAGDSADHIDATTACKDNQCVLGK